MKDDTQNVIMWTAKEDIVLETVERDGVSFVKKEYIDKKYGETAWIFKTAYSFFCKEAEKRIPKPEQAESPIWIFAEETEFNNKIKQQGVKDNLDIIKSPFYPLLKKELMDSWKKLFTSQNLCKKYTEGAVWQLKKEWILEKYIL